MRYEFVEILVRIAVQKYRKTIVDVSDAVEKLLAEHVSKYFQDMPGSELPDTFRSEELYCEEVDEVLLRHERTLKIIYKGYCRAPKQRRGVVASGALARFGLNEWKSLLDDCALVRPLPTCPFPSLFLLAFA